MCSEDDWKSFSSSCGFFVVVMQYLLRHSSITRNSNYWRAGGYVLLVNYSMLSASCANETLQLTHDTYPYFQKHLYESGHSCWGDSDGEINLTTATTCAIQFDSPLQAFKTNCTNAGGQYYKNQTSDDFFDCSTSYNGDKLYTVDMMVRNYPVCAGASCTVSEVKSAFDETIIADATRGPLGERLESICSSNVFLPATSSTHNYFNSGDLICIPFLMMATCSFINLI